MSARGEDVVAEARKWLDTPFHHQGRLIGVGVDCAGLLIGVLHGLNLSDYDIDGYARQPNGATLQAECDAVMLRIPAAEVALGDVLLMRMGRNPQHLGIVTRVEDGLPTAMIHSFAEAPKGCVEHSLDDRWRKRIVQVYRFRGVEP